MLISQILRRKDGPVTTIKPSSTVADALNELSVHSIGALVVSADGASIDGIISERDIVRSLARNGTDAVESTVADVMTASVVTCGVEATTEELMATMTTGRFRHVPVVDDDCLVGIVSIGDIVNARLAELEAEREQLTNYISGH